jgi:hypothetical protein
VIDVGGDTTSEIFQLLITAQVIVFGLRDARGAAVEVSISRIRARLPHGPIFVCVAPDEMYGQLLPSLAWSGVDEVFVLRGDSEWNGFKETLRRRLANPSPEIPIRRLTQALPDSSGRTILLWGLRAGFMARSQSDAHQSFAIDIKTINRRLRDIGCPAIGGVLRYGLLFHVAEHKRRGVRSLSDIAVLLGAAGPKTLWSRKRTAKKRAKSGNQGTRLLEAALTIR